MLWITSSSSNKYKTFGSFELKLNPLRNPSHQWINEALYIKYPEPVWAVREYLEPYGVEI